MWRGLFAGIAGTLLLASGPALAAPEKRVALVLGNARYAVVGEVAGVGGNAAAMEAALRKAGFAVTRADNLGRVALESALERFRDALAGADLGFVYYSGLAVGVGEREYLLPADAAPAMEGDLSREALDLDGVLGDLRAAGRRAVVVLDPAANNPLAERVGGGALGAPLEADGLFVIYAHRPGVPPVAAAGPEAGRRGADPFTAALAREIVKPGVPLRDALAEVARSVATRSGGRQLPWLQDRLGGDLVLVPAVVAAAKPPVKAAAKDTAKEPAATDTPPAPPAPAAPASLPPGRYEAVRSGMMFERPAVGARGVAPLAPGDAVTVIAPAQPGSWVRVRDKAGRTGYVTAGTLSERWGEPPPPVAALPRGVIESGPSAEPPPSGAGPSVAALPPSGASDPQGERQGERLGDSPAMTAEQRAMRALGGARTAADRARAGRAGYWAHQFPNGDRYEGEWSQQGQAGGFGRPTRQGFGVYRFANGQIYEGEWARDVMSGYGIMSFLDGSRFAGQFRDGQPDGPGVFRYGDGSQSAGLWRGPARLDE